MIQSINTVHSFSEIAFFSLTSEKHQEMGVNSTLTLFTYNSYNICFIILSLEIRYSQCVAMISF